MTRPNPAAPPIGLISSEVVDGELRLALANDSACIEAARLEILRFLEPGALDPLVVNRLEVVFEEVISNILRHGFRRGSEQSVAVRVTSLADAIVLTIEDDGVPFNPLAAPEPPAMASLQSAPLGGLGIALMRKLAADVRYEAPAPDPLAAFKPRNRLTVAVAIGA